jgi:WD40 repeat protein
MISKSKSRKMRFVGCFVRSLGIALRLLVIGTLGFPTTSEAQEPETANPSESLSAVAFSPDGTTLASVTHGQADQIGLWDTRTGQNRFLSGTSNIQLSGLGFSPNGQMIASPTDRGAIQLWDVKSRQLRWTFGQINDPTVRNVVFSPLGTLVASLSAAGTVKLWDPSTGSLVRDLVSVPFGVRSLGFSPNGAMLAFGGQNGDLALWDVNKARIDFTLAVGDGLAVGRLTFSPAGGILAAVTEDGRVALVDWRSGTVKRVLDAPQGGVIDIAFTPDGAILASATSGEVLLWNVDTGDLRSVLPDPSGEGIRGLLLGPDGNSLVTLGKDFKIRVWDLLSGELRDVLAGQQDSIAAATFSTNSSNQQTLASVGWDGKVITWGLARGETLRTFRTSGRWRRVSLPGGDRRLQ